MKGRAYNKKSIVFFDFDNTITVSDVLDGIIERFSEDDAWRGLEEEWRRGRIGSRQCLKGQVEGIRVSRKELDRYLRGVKLDPYFKKLARLLGSRNIRAVIVSDNFDYMLNGILKAHGMEKEFDVYCNSVKFAGDRIVPAFPLSNEECGGCGHCKSTTIRRVASHGEATFYIGDGLSDRCASKEADVVFAKAELRKYLEKSGVKHIPFEGLKDVYDHFKELA
jgi:2,3-diketo-5-methylthio-1-phosphopentane phosphatase